MRRETWLADEVEVTVSGIFTTRHVFHTATGTLGELTSPAFKPRSLFRGIDGEDLTVTRASWWRGTYELRDATAVVGTARPMGLFRRENLVQFRTSSYRLVTAGIWGRVWNLLDEAGEPVTVIRAREAFRRGAILRVMLPVDVALLVFTYCLVSARWQEQTSAASTAATAGS